MGAEQGDYAQAGADLEADVDPTAAAAMGVEDKAHEVVETGADPGSGKGLVLDAGTVAESETCCYRIRCN